MKTVFRTTWKYLALQEGAILLFSLMGAGFFLWERIYWLGILCLLASVVWLIAFLKLLNSKIEIDELAIVFSVDKKESRVMWRDVIAARFEPEARSSKFILLWTAEGDYAIPVHQFDYKTIWQSVEQLAPASALEETAILNTPSHKKHKAEIAEKIAGIQDALHLRDHWFLKVAGWGLVIFLLPVAISLLTMMEFLLALTPLIFSVFGLIIILHIGSLDVDRESLTRKTLLGRYRMRWDEIRWIEYHEEDSSLLLCGENKQLGIPAPGWCAKPQRDLYWALLFSEIEKRGIEMRKTVKVLFKRSKNTRVRA